jgi:hypothetical protein
LNRTNTITACDAIHYGNVMHEVCKVAGIDKETYDMVLFEVGYQLVQLVYKHSPMLADQLLKNEAYAYWNWFYVEYLKHDDFIKTNRLNNYRYLEIKNNWINTFKMQKKLTILLQYKRFNNAK